MGLVMLFGVIIVLIIDCILTTRANQIIIYKLLGNLLILAIMPIVLAPIVCTKPPIQDFPYQAEVIINNHEQTIYFSDFTQEDNKIYINEYSVWKIHWTDFEFYNLSESPLTITLTDNDNKFIYTDRQSNKTYNTPVNNAIQ
jgi:hypothetical protein